MQTDISRLDLSIHKTLTEADVLAEANRCLYCYDAPCTHACPTHIDVPSFIQKITTNNLFGSTRVIMDANPLGASCARVCPTEELCEGACVLGKDESPIRIGDLQRYVTDWARGNDLTLFKAGPSTGMKVAVIGAGPAGLAAARDLLRFGHEVVLYDGKTELGGLNTYGIVPFRLPVDVAVWEADQIVRLGAKAKRGVYVGRDVTAEAVLASYDAVVLACGMGSVPKLGIPGEDLEGVLDAIEFIERVKHGQPVRELGRHVVVIGAGNTAIDAATCSKRLGVDRVSIYYRRTEREMSAYPFEYDFAKQEGVEFRWLTAPVRIIGEAGLVRAVEFVRTRLAADPTTGEVRVLPVAESAFEVEVDTVIRAIGQSRLVELMEQFGVAHEDGVVHVDGGLQTSNPKVFAAGDCIFSKGSREAMVVEAAEQGKAAARSVHQFLQSRLTGRR